MARAGRVRGGGAADGLRLGGPNPNPKPKPKPKPNPNPKPNQVFGWAVDHFEEVATLTLALALPSPSPNPSPNFEEVAAQLDCWLGALTLSLTLSLSLTLGRTPTPNPNPNPNPNQVRYRRRRARRVRSAPTHWVRCTNSCASRCYTRGTASSMNERQPSRVYTGTQTDRRLWLCSQWHRPERRWCVRSTLSVVRTRVHIKPYR